MSFQSASDFWAHDTAGSCLDLLDRWEGKDISGQGSSAKFLMRSKTFEGEKRQKMRLVEFFRKGTKSEYIDVINRVNEDEGSITDLALENNFHPARILAFAKEHGIKVKTKKGNRCRKEMKYLNISGKF
tara:strand:+ start:2612 stop:2998 length:387 start_codon:yes stop_codon:yes gene_type:complete